MRRVADYTFSEQPDGTVVVAGGEHDYVLSADEADGSGFRCSCAAGTYRGSCKHAAEWQRRRGVAAAGAERETPPPREGTETRDGEIPPPDAPEDGGPPHTLQLYSVAELLANPGALTPPTPVIPLLAWRGRVTLASAREKTGGKSTLLTAACAAVTTGAEFLGQRCLRGAVLWVTADHEHPHDIVQRVVRFGGDPELFHVLWPLQSFADLAAALARLGPLVLIVIDTLWNFAEQLVEDPKSSGDWPDVLKPLLRLARERDLALVLLHHLTKGPHGGYRDSTHIGAAVDMILEVQRDEATPTVRRITALGRWPQPEYAVELVGDAYRLLQQTE